jgi:hypothetical protein
VPGRQWRLVRIALGMITCPLLDISVVSMEYHLGKIW